MTNQLSADAFDSDSITRPLDVAHFPPPVPCPVCGHLAGFRAAGALWCTWPACDAGAALWRALDRYFRRRVLDRPDLHVTTRLVSLRGRG
jgi:hypothetical protein